MKRSDDRVHVAAFTDGRVKEERDHDVKLGVLVKAPNTMNNLPKGFCDKSLIRDPRVVAAVAWIEHQLATVDININEIAQAVNLSSSYLRHLFQQQTGMTPRRYHKVLRLQRAHDLLSQSFLSVKQVMAEAGWTDQSHFCRDYKLVYGESPSKVRSTRTEDGQPNVA